MSADTSTATPSGLDVYPPVIASGGVNSITGGDESVIVGGTPTDPTVRANTSKDAVTSEALSVGDWVTVYNVAGVPTVRKADWTFGHAGECNGYVAAAYALGATARVFISGVNGHVAGMTVGDVWLGAAGAGTNTPPPTTAGYICQRIGRALSATEVGIEFEPAMLMAAAVVAVPTPGWARLAQVVTTGSAATIAFSSIPGGYTDLMLTITGRDTSAAAANVGARMKINGDAVAANYSAEQFHEELNAVNNGGNNASSVAGSIFARIPGSLNNANAVGSATVIIPNYRGTAFYKTVTGLYGLFFSNAASPLDAGNDFFVWKSVAAITDLLLTAGGTAFVDGTTATLYGLG